MHFSRFHVPLLLQSALVTIFCCAAGCSHEQPTPLEESASSDTSAGSLSEAEEQSIRTYCGACHRLPDPQTFAKNSWYDEVHRGFEFGDRSKRTDLVPPPRGQVVQWFRSQAPEQLPWPATPSGAPGQLAFRREVLPAAPGQSTAATISCFNWLKSPESPGRLLVSDMRGGGLLELQPGLPGGKRLDRVLAKLNNPTRVEPCDLNGDGREDLLVADLGSFRPEDHTRGRVVWLRREAGGEYTSVPLLEGLGRVAEVRVADFNGDGRTDILVGEFGWLETGGVHLLLQIEESQPDQPKFETRLLDSRHGVIHLPVVDWNGDGHPDFVALFSQEHETVELFLNDGSGEFQTQTLNPPEDPAFGSSGIQLADLDQDGDLDVLYTNGDTFDSFDLKYFHGIQWLENRGRAGAVSHRVTDLPGVSRALAGDLDGDGDLDILATAFLPAESVRKAGLKPEALDSIIWLEQVRPGEFVRHSLETGRWIHAALEIGDFDADGDLDFATGNFLEANQLQESPLTIWWNETSGKP